MVQRCVLCGALAVLAAASVAAGEFPGQVSVSGEAMICVTPDEALIGVGVECFHAELDKAKQANDEACARLLQAVKTLGVEEKHLQTDQLELELKYQDYAHPSLGVEGYFARRAYSITLKDIKLFEKVVDVALKNGANRLMGFEFRSTQLRQHRDEARKRAIRAAKDKAALFATELGVTLGKVRSISEGYFGFTASRRWGWGAGSFQDMSQNYASQGEGGLIGETLPLGEIGIRAQVSVTFDVP